MKYIFPVLLLTCLLLVVVQCHANMICRNKCPRGMKECVSLNRKKTKDCATYKCVMRGYKLHLDLISHKCQSSYGKCHANGKFFRHKKDKKNYKCQCKISGSRAEIKSYRNSCFIIEIEQVRQSRANHVLHKGVCFTGATLMIVFVLRWT